MDVKEHDFLHQVAKRGQARREADGPPSGDPEGPPRTGGDDETGDNETGTMTTQRPTRSGLDDGSERRGEVKAHTHAAFPGPHFETGTGEDKGTTR